MRWPMFLLTLTLFLSSCAELPQEGRAAAILDRAQPEATSHAEALTGTDINLMRQTGLRLITVVRCWPDGCEGGGGGV